VIQKILIALIFLIVGAGVMYYLDYEPVVWEDCSEWNMSVTEKFAYKKQVKSLEADLEEVADKRAKDMYALTLKYNNILKEKNEQLLDCNC